MDIVVFMSNNAFKIKQLHVILRRFFHGLKSVTDSDKNNLFLKNSREGPHGFEVTGMGSWGTKNEDDRSIILLWSGKRDLNSRPRPWQGRALPTELFPHYPYGVRAMLHVFVGLQS
jgi:hypothetical protein